MGPPEVLQDRDRTARREPAHGGDAPAVLLVGAVREVEPHHVDPGVEQRREAFLVVGGRAEGGDDAGAGHQRMIGGEGKESNLPSRARRDNAVLKTGEATGPLPSPWWSVADLALGTSGRNVTDDAIVPVVTA